MARQRTATHMLNSLDRAQIKRALGAARKAGSAAAFYAMVKMPQPSRSYFVRDDDSLHSLKAIVAHALRQKNPTVRARDFHAADAATCLRSLKFDVIHDKQERLQQAKDLLDLSQRINITETTRKRLIEARLGQGRFRKELIELWDGKCPLTGCNELAMLRASHIKPWRNSTDAERLNPANGLLLSANCDVLFDKFLVSFDDSGKLICSAKNENLLGWLNLQNLKISMPVDNEEFLEYHRARFANLDRKKD